MSNFDDILQIRTVGICSYVLRRSEGLYLIDGGFIGAGAAIFRAIRERGWENEAIRGIIITHGHLDHVLNIRELAAQTGAWVAAPRLDADHYEGKFRYQGASKLCGQLEKLGRWVLKYQSFTVDQWLDDGSLVPPQDGLTAIHLPGHTEGHMGFHDQSRGLLFCADLFASYGNFSHFPPDFLNSRPELVRKSIQRVLAMDLTGLLPNHCDGASPAIHLARFRTLAGKMKI